LQDAVEAERMVTKLPQPDAWQQLILKALGVFLATM
jgi:hypothetical protein